MRAAERGQKALSRAAVRRARSPDRDGASARSPARLPASLDQEELLIEKIMGSFQDIPAPVSGSPENEKGADSSEGDELRVLKDLLEMLGL